MSYLIGTLLALMTALIASWIGFDRRSFYATLLIVIATYYVLFATMAVSSHALVVESSVMGIFVLLAAIGFRANMWIVALALALHGGFDIVHGRLVTNPGVPSWWPAFCASYDVVAAIALAWLTYRSSASQKRI